MEMYGRSDYIIRPKVFGHSVLWLKWDLSNFPGLESLFLEIDHPLKAFPEDFILFLSLSLFTLSLSLFHSQTLSVSFTFKHFLSPSHSLFLSSQALLK